MVSVNKERFILEINNTVLVSVYDDGENVTEDIIITITLIQISDSSSSTDLFNDVATLIIPGPRGMCIMCTVTLCHDSHNYLCCMHKSTCIFLISNRLKYIVDSYNEN